MARDQHRDQKVLIKKHGIKTMKESSEKRNPSKNNSYRIAYIPCSCDGEILVARYDGEFDMLDLCLFESQNSFKFKMKLWHKLRYIYQLFRTGQPFTDQIILQRDKIEELKGFLNTI